MSKRWTFLLSVLLFTVSCGHREEAAKTVIIDGVRHILNPAVPLKGTVELRLEKVREVNP